YTHVVCPTTLCYISHLNEENPDYEFNRKHAYGKRLDIPAVAAVRFEPGDEKEIQLVEYKGKRNIYGFHGKVNGPIDETRVVKPDDYTKDSEIIDEANLSEDNANKESGYKK